MKDLGKELRQIRDGALEQQALVQRAAALRKRKELRVKEIDQAKASRRSHDALLNLQQRLRSAAAVDSSLPIMQLIEDDFLDSKDYQRFCTDNVIANYQLDCLIGAAETVVNELNRIHVNAAVGIKSRLENEGEPLDEERIFYPALVAFW